MSSDSSGDDCTARTLPSQECSQPQSLFMEGEEASRNELVVGSVDSHRSLARSQGSSVAVEGDQLGAEGVVVVPSPHSAPMDLRREAFARGKKDSTESDISSNGETDSNSRQDTGSQSNTKEIVVTRKWLCKGLVKKSLVPRVHEVFVSIPTSITKTRCERAKLLLSVVPFKPETTPWPERFSYLQLQLLLPKKYIFVLTMEHACKLVVSIAPSAGDGSVLPGDPTPLHLTMDIPDLECEQSKEIRLLSHPTILDASCTEFKFLVKAHLEFTPRKPFPHEVREEEDFLYVVV